jgi:hypothetical protein
MAREVGLHAFVENAEATEYHRTSWNQMQAVP